MAEAEDIREIPRDIQAVPDEFLPVDNSFSSTVSRVSDGLMIRIPKPETPFYRVGDAVGVVTKRKWAALQREMTRAKALQARIDALQKAYLGKKKRD